MPVKKGAVLIRRPHEPVPLAIGMCYLATRKTPSGWGKSGGTITRLEWAPGFDPEEAGPGEYDLEFHDGARLTIVVSQHLRTACGPGPEVLRFQALGPLMASSVAPEATAPQ